VLRFSVGFGRPLVIRRVGRDNTELSLSAFPLGGYVKMLDEREGPVTPAELPRAFNRQPVLKRLAIVGAGPVANFLLAIVVYWALFLIGIPGVKPILGEPGKGTVAAASGFRQGEKILSIDREPVATWQDVRWKLIDHAVQKSTVSVEVQAPSGTISSRQLELSGLSVEDLDSEFLAKLGLTQFRPPLRPVVGQIIDGGAAARAGLQVGDEITSINGKPIALWQDFVEEVRNNAGKPLALGVNREGARLNLQITPVATDEKGVRVGKIGAAPRVDRSALDELYTEVRYPSPAALQKAIAKTWDTSVFSLRMLGKMVTGSVSWKNISGPLAIADYAGQTAHLGLMPYLSFIALISISLGVLNLLPIPLLDGGHLMYYIVEIIKGSPVSDRIMEIGQQLGMALLIGLMLFAFYNDINRLITG
jgi:regulator of sigma E protease